MTDIIFPLDRLPEGAVLRSVAAAPATFHGRDCLRVELTDDVTRDGVAGVDYVDQPTFVELPIEMCTGTIEVDISSRLNGKTDFPSRAFAGVAFHVRDDASAFQSVYLRPLNGRNVDPPPPRDERAVQYFSYPNWPFDRLRAERPDGGFESGADIGPDEWMRLHIDISDESVSATVDGVVVLALAHPLTPPQRGVIGLFVDIGTEAFFADLKVAVRS